jgi:hypothetical protein
MLDPSASIMLVGEPVIGPGVAGSVAAVAVAAPGSIAQLPHLRQRDGPASYLI